MVGNIEGQTAQTPDQVYKHKPQKGGTGIMAFVTTSPSHFLRLSYFFP